MKAGCKVQSVELLSMHRFALHHDINLMWWQRHRHPISQNVEQEGSEVPSHSWLFITIKASLVDMRSFV